MVQSGLVGSALACFKAGFYYISRQGTPWRFFLLNGEVMRKNQETSAVKPEFEKVCLASSFLLLVNIVSPASAFQHSGSLWYCWSQISPVLPSYAY
jgi:hypothetical protein